MFMGYNNKIVFGKIGSRLFENKACDVLMVLLRLHDSKSLKKSSMSRVAKEADITYPYMRKLTSDMVEEGYITMNKIDDRSMYFEFTSSGLKFARDLLKLMLHAENKKKGVTSNG